MDVFGKIFGKQKETPTVRASLDKLGEVRTLMLLAYDVPSSFLYRLVLPFSFCPANLMQCEKAKLVFSVCRRHSLVQGMAAFFLAPHVDP